MPRSESATDVLKVTLGENLVLKQKIVDPPHWQFVFKEDVISTHDDILYCKNKVIRLGGHKSKTSSVFFVLKQIAYIFLINA